MEILICRLRPWMAVEVSKNLSFEGHGVHSIDHGQMEEYILSGEFKSCHQWHSLSSSDIELEYQIRQIIKNYHIELVIITQKLWRYSNIAEKVCKELGIRVVFTEYFFDNKLIFDDIGLQYTQENQSIGESTLPIDWPKKDREPQPVDRTKEEVLDRYNIPQDSKIVVVYGQVPWDMSLVESPAGMTYDEYIDGLFLNNPDTIFLFKPHPKIHYRESREFSFPNMKKVDESLRTLFQFEAHTAYSSTVIFEGVSKGLRFATVGYHLLQQHTYKIKPGNFNDIYNKIISYQLDMDKVRKAVSYITNIYAMDMRDKYLAERLIMA